VIAELRDLLAHDVVVETWKSQDGYGEPSFNSAVTVQGRVQQGARLIRMLTGEERVSATRVYLDTTMAIDPRSRITLPVEFTPRQPPILRVDRVSDESQLDHTVIWL
jgi:hypothetical protein